MNIHFQQLSRPYVDLIFSWLEQDFVAEFWDNSQAHKDDIVNFVSGRRTPSNYIGGKYVYWLAFAEETPFAMLMTLQETHQDDIGNEKVEQLSRTGHTYGIDYMIGNPDFFGKGYGGKTLAAFIDYFRETVDPKADTFLIDPEINNIRAKHVYMKAGFKHICDFVMGGECSGEGKPHALLVKTVDPKISVIPASLEEYPLIQNMAQFYHYDLSRDCGHISSDWGFPEEGLYKTCDFKLYFKDPSRKAYLVKVYDEIAGFILLNQATENKENKWNMGEFFILAKFQGQGIAKRVAYKVWEMNPGKWEISVIPQNKRALAFWEKVIREFFCGRFLKSIKNVCYDEHQPKRIIFEFYTE